MGNPAIFNGKFTKLLTARGIINSNGSVNEYDGPWNYIPQGRFELNTAAAVPATVTLSSGLPTGTATASATSITVGSNTTTPLIGGSSMIITAAAAWAAGQGFSLPSFAVRTADLGKVLTFSFYYQATTGSTNLNWSGALGSQSLMVYIYDVTAAAWVQPTGFLGMNTSTTSGLVSGTFQASTVVGQQYQMYVLASQASAGACSVSFDGMQITPQVIPIGAAITDMIQYTPTFTGFGTPTAVRFFSRRIGDSLYVQGSFSPGTSTAVTAQITLGFAGANANVTIDSNKLGALGVVGSAEQSASSSAFFGISALGLGGNNFLNLGAQTSGSGSAAIANGNALGAGAGGLITITALVPISGWSSNLQMSSDTDTRVISFSGSQSSQAVTANVTDIAFASATNGNRSAAWNGTQFVVQTSGDYFFSTTYTSSANSNVTFYLNGNLFSTGSAMLASNAYSASALFPACKAGDVLSIRSNVSVTVSGGTATVFRLSGPSVIAANESVNARYFSSTSTITGTLATVVYTTKGWDTHSAYNATTGIFTSPVTGKYQVNASVAMTGSFLLNSILDLQVQQTGSSTQISESKDYSGGAATQMNTNVGDQFYLLAGDTLKVQASNSGSTPALAATTTQNWLSIARVGN